MSRLLSRHDVARQSFWSKQNLPDTAERLNKTGGEGVGDTQAWTPDGTPFACRVSPVALATQEIQQAWTLQDLVHWHIVASDAVLITEGQRLRLTVQRPSGEITFDVEVLRPRIASLNPESRTLVRGPV